MLSNFYYLFIWCVCVWCIYTHTDHNVPVEVREQLLRVTSLPLLCEPLGVNSGCQVYLQAPDLLSHLTCPTQNSVQKLLYS